MTIDPKSIHCVLCSSGEHQPRVHLDPIERAYALAAEIHRDQRYGNLPYICHPRAVAKVLQRYGADEDTICAAILHDAGEDSGDSEGTMSIIKAEFDLPVYYLVGDMTRKADESYEEYRMRIPPRAHPIKFADSGHNLSGLTTGDRREARYVENLHHCWPATRAALPNMPFWPW